MICPSCNELVINIWKVGWVHKNIYTTCTLKDGLTLVEIEKDLYQYEIIDENARRFFINKFNELFENQKSGLNVKSELFKKTEKEQDAIFKEIIQPKTIKHKKFDLEIYD